MEPGFQRLAISLRPNVVWIRDSQFRYRKCEERVTVLEAGLLCQIGFHLGLEGQDPGIACCQIVSGRYRGLRFEYSSRYFEPRLVAA